MFGEQNPYSEDYNPIKIMCEMARQTRYILSVYMTLYMIIYVFSFNPEYGYIVDLYINDDKLTHFISLTLVPERSYIV